MNKLRILGQTHDLVRITPTTGHGLLPAIQPSTSAQLHSCVEAQLKLPGPRCVNASCATCSGVVRLDFHDLPKINVFQWIKFPWLPTSPLAS